MRRIAFFGLTLHTSFLFPAITAAWNLTTGGNYSPPANWSPATTPTGIDSEADFGAKITAASTITLDVTPTVGTMTFNNVNSYTISPSAAFSLMFQVSAGNASIQVTTGAHSITAPITLMSPLSISQSSTSPFTIMGVITGGNMVTMSGPQTLILNPVTPNLYSGGTMVNGGVLQCGSTGALPANQNLAIIAPGSVNLGGFSQTIGILSGGGGITTTASEQLTTNVPVVMMTSYTGAMTGSGSLNITGMQTLTLTNPMNNYSGGTTVNMTGGMGGLTCGAADVIPKLGPFTLTSGTFNLNNFGQSIGSLSGSGPITLGTAQLTVNSTTNTTYSGIISDTGMMGSLVQAGTAVLTLSGVSTFNNGVTIDSGTIQCGVVNVFVPSMVGTFENITVDAVGTFDLNGFNQSIGALNGSGAVTFGVGNLTVTTASNAAFSGTMSGSGMLIYDGTAMFTISGPNMYTGGTVINGAGSLVTGAVNTLPVGGPVTLNAGILNLNGFSQSIGGLSGVGNISMGAAQLSVGPAATSTYSGAMTDGGAGGSLNIIGPGVEILSNAANSYTGGTFVNGGTLQNGVNNALPMTGNLTVNSPGTYSLGGFDQTIGALSGNGVVQLTANTLTTSTSMNSTFFGPIMGLGGTLVKNGTSTLTILGPNSYSFTTVNMGTLQGNTMSLQGMITNNGATVIFNQPFPGVFTGTLLPPGGALMITGGGNVIFPSPTAQTATTTEVVFGKLTVDGILNSTTLTVDPGGVLGGIGTIVGNTTVNGLLQPGDNSIGTLTITGNYVQGAGSAYDVEINPVQSDLLAVSGTVMINSPANVIVMPEVGLYAPSKSYTIMSSMTAPVTGTFSSVTLSNPFLAASLTYNTDPSVAGSVQLLLKLAPFSNVIKGGNPGAVAECINAAADSGSVDFANIVAHLIFLPIEDVRKALDQMQPSILKGMVIAEENNLTLVRTTLSQRMNQLSQIICEDAEITNRAWDIWTNLSGDFLDEGRADKNHGFEAKTGAATAGIDVALAKGLYFGAAGAYSDTYLKWHEDKGDGHINSFYTGPYASWFNRRVFANAAGLVAWNYTRASRHAVFEEIFNRRAQNHHHGFGGLAHLDIGVIAYPGGSATFAPFFMGDYIYVYEQKFSETGAQSLDLNVQASHADMWRSETGIRVTKCSPHARHKWVHDLKLSWVHEQRMRGRHYTASFQVANFCHFNVVGMHPNHDLFNIETGLTGMFFHDKLLTSFRYEGEFGEGVRDQSAYLQIKYNF